MSVTIGTKPYSWCKTEIRVSNHDEPDYDAVVVITTGASSLQTYATREQLISLANMLMNAAQSVGVEA